MNTDPLGFFETPAPVADRVAATLFQRAPSAGDTILYPGAGRGNLAAAVHRRCSVRDLPTPNAVFIERNPSHRAVLEARFCGADATMNHGVPDCSPASRRAHTPYQGTATMSRVDSDIEIYTQDFLQDPPIVETGVEFIVTNPPYTAYQEIPGPDRDAYSASFSTATGQFPLYAPFIEQCLSLLAEDGTLVFLAPRQYLTLNATEPLRHLLRSNGIRTPEALPEVLMLPLGPLSPQ